MRLQWRALMLWLFVCVGAGVAYVLFATAQFVATARVVLEPHLSATPIDAASAMTTTLDSSLADSQVLVLQSERNLRHVFDALNLANDPDFADGGFDAIGWIRAQLAMRPKAASLPSDDMARSARERAYARFAERVAVQRPSEPKKRPYPLLSARSLFYCGFYTETGSYTESGSLTTETDSKENQVRPLLMPR